MSNPDDYGNLGITGAPVDIGDPPGRGYIDPDHQFQVAVLGGKRGGAEQADALAWLAGQLSANRSAPPIRRLPEAVSLEQMSASTRPELVRIGIAASSLAPIEVDLSDESVIVFGPPVLESRRRLTCSVSSANASTQRCRRCWCCSETSAKLLRITTG